MMDEFVSALFGNASAGAIPAEYDWFAPLIGDWDFDYFDDYYGTGKTRQVKGEWLFRRVLNGIAVEDLFLCPSRATAKANPQPDGEYGAALRVFDAGRKCYNMVYACVGYMTRLEVHNENGFIVCSVLGQDEKWMFSEITENTFHWQNATKGDDNKWRINSNVYATRRRA